MAGGVSVKRLEIAWLIAAFILALSVAISVFATPLVAGASRAAKVGRNVEIAGETGPDRQVVEPGIAVDPRNSDIVVVGAEDRKLVPPGGCFGTAGCHTWGGYYRSTDEGASWSSRLVPGFPGDTSPAGLASPLQQFTHIGHVSVAFDRSGNVYYTGFVAQVDDSGLVASSIRVAVVKFANDGADYVGATVLSTGPEFFPRIAVDTTGGPHDGNIYLTFINSLSLGYQALFARSTDGGLTFSTPIPTPGSGLPIAPAVDPVGNVYVESVHCTGPSLQCSSDSGATILVTKSTDGGITFGRSIVVANIEADPVFFPGNGFFYFFFLSYHIAADANGVYVVWDDFGTGDANVHLSRSTDGGLTWSNPVAVNDVTQGEQFMSTITVSGGIISIVWYDSRFGQLSNGTITNLDVFYAESRDAGASFSSSVRVTSVSFDPNLVVLGDLGDLAFRPFIGDRLGIVAGPDAVHVAWTDNRNACDTIDPTFGCVDQDVFAATVTP